MIAKVILSTLCFSFVLASNDPVVNLPVGKIRGRSLETGNKKYVAFQGIPYAAPPLRFQEARAVEPWPNVLNTTKDAKPCISNTYTSEGNSESEDCLYLNVYTPNLKPENNYTVMVFIHGGGFTSGSADSSIYGPEYLIAEGEVVLVVIQYRLGPFGFLSTGDEVLPGNLGLKDQVFALKWVQRNIHLFGGDPGRVTIFGQSAGAASVGLHLISKKSKGLFRAAIAESGSALNLWTSDPNPKEYAFKLANLIDSSFSSDVNSTLELKTLLGNASLDKITVAVSTLQDENLQVWPVLEPENHEGAFITKPHFNLVGKVSKVPLMIGVNTEEALYFYNTLEKLQGMASLLDQDPSKLLPQNFEPKPNASIAKLTKEIKNIYLKDNETFSENYSKLLKFLSDQNFVRGNIAHALLQSATSSVYFYKFAYEGREYVPCVKIPGAGVIPHAAELPFLFNFELFKTDNNTKNVLTQNRMTKLWTNFAKHLNPTPRPDDLLGNITWPKVCQKKITLLNINQTLSLEQNFRKNTFGRWSRLFFEYGVRPINTF